ncbi:MAG: winged helix-turn-helix transcriptional regulator [Ktedonobacterales bacterium]|nr:winged helix-turn-helix transcriptional regulator [Ktedonobacterales bacterium]
METRPDSRGTAPRAVNLRRGRAPDIEILACATYDLLLSLHVSLSSPEFDYADYDVGRAWIEAALARCAARDAGTLGVLGRYLGGAAPGSLHATLISLVWECPEPRTPKQFLDWVRLLPAEQFAEVLLDQAGLGADWPTLLAAALGEGEIAEGARSRLLTRYSGEVRPTVAAILGDVEGTRDSLLRALEVWNEVVFAGEEARIVPLLQHEAAALRQQRTALPLDDFIGQAMHGVQWQRPADLRRIVFAPSYFCRPAVYYHFWNGTLTFCAPLEHTRPDAEAQRGDPRAPDEETRKFFIALGDPTRLRILGLLAEREMYLTELAEHLRLTKATIKYHMVHLRDAGLVTLYDRERLTYYALRADIAHHASQLLHHYLGRALNSHD